MRPDCRPESFGPLLLENGDDRRRNLVYGSGRVYGDDGTGLRVTSLPRRLGESVEGLGDAMVKLVVGGLDSIPSPAAVRSRQRGRDGQSEQYRKIGHEPARGKLIRGSDLRVAEAAAGDLIGVGGQKESIGNHDKPVVEGGADQAIDELGPGRHEQKRFSAGRELWAGVEKKSPDLIPDLRAARFADRCIRNAAGGKRLAKATDLRRLADAFRTLENDQLPASHRHPSVMIELVAPFRMPSVIQLFT
jgi:hypothetical protein